MWAINTWAAMSEHALRYQIVFWQVTILPGPELGRCGEKKKKQSRVSVAACRPGLRVPMLCGGLRHDPVFRRSNQFL